MTVLKDEELKNESVEQEPEEENAEPIAGAEETPEQEPKEDFKKKEGFKRSIVLSHEYNLYRQNYCGCRYSKRDNIEE